MTTLISKEKNIYMVFNTRNEALNFAFYHLTKNLCEEIVKKEDDFFYIQKSHKDERLVVVNVYEHITKLRYDRTGSKTIR